MALLCCLFSILISSAQYPGVGDTLPDLQVKLMDQVQPISLRRFRGKPLVIDFWATYCTPCIPTLRKIPSLAAQLKDSIQFIAVTPEDTATINRYLHVRKSLAPARAFIAAGSKTLFDLFVPESLPHMVWVTSEGKIAAITYGSSLDLTTIRAFLEHQDLQLEVKARKMDLSQPLFPPAPGAPPYYATIGGPIQGAASQTGLLHDSLANTSRYVAINIPLWQLYANHMKGAHIITNSKFACWDLPDPHNYYYTKENPIAPEKWAQQFHYSYESVFPLGTPKETISAAVIADIEKFLHLRASIDSIWMDCLQLVRCEDMPFASPASTDRFFGEDGNMLKMQQFSLDALTYYLNHHPGLPPVFDATNDKRLFDLQLDNSKWSSVSELNGLLQPYGLTLLPVKKLLPVFHIRKISPVAQRIILSPIKTRQ